MAASALTILKTWAAGEQTAQKLVDHALGYAPGTDNLDMDDWVELKKHSDNVQPVAARLLPKYEKMWEEFGKPENYEAWQRARYPE